MKNRTWIDDVLDATKLSESPRSFIFWASMFCLGASTKRQISIQMGDLFKIYPNLYVLLVAESGLGKQFPIDMSKALLSVVDKVKGIRMVTGGQNSVQGILKSLGKAVNRANGVMIRNAEAAFISGEFANFLVKDPMAFSTIMELYDTGAHDEYDKILTNESFHLKNVFVSWLAASNMDLFQHKVDDHELKGGFLGRMLSIKEDDIENLNSLTTPLPPIDYEKLAGRLIEVSNLKGEFNWGPGAAKRYDDWYYPFYGDKNRLRDKARFSNRLRGHVIKVAMCLSLSYKDDLLLLVEDIEAAIRLCEPLLENVMVMTEDMGQSKYKGLNAIITHTLIHAKGHKILRSKLLAMNRGEWNLKEFNDTVALLESSNIVEIDSNNGQVFIQLTDEAKGQLVKVKESEPATGSNKKKRRA